MLRVLFATISILLEPAFIEVKAVLGGNLIAHMDLGSLLTAIVGFLACVGMMNALAYYEGKKALQSIYSIARELPINSLQVAETISAERLVSEFGYLHHAFNFGPSAQNTGNVTVIYDCSGQFMDYQCAFNMFGNSYLIVPSKTKLEDMPLYQQYVALHEIGHGSMTGGVIWTRAKSLGASGVIASVFGLITTQLTPLGIFAVALTLLAAYISSRKVTIESEAEVFADSYAIRYIAKGNIRAAQILVRKLIERLTDVDYLLGRYDQLINKSRLRNLNHFDRLIAAGKSLNIISHPSIMWVHYFAGVLLLWWTIWSARPNSYSSWLPGAFALLFIVIIAFRKFTKRQISTLEDYISSRIGG